MNRIEIRRCPVCGTINQRVKEVVEALERVGAEITTTNGEASEFTVLVDGQPVVHNQGDLLPTVEEVVSAVQHTVPVGAS